LQEQEALEGERAQLGEATAKLDLRREELKAREARGLGQEATRLVDQMREVQKRLDTAKKELRENASAEAFASAQSVTRDGGELLGEVDAHRLSLEPEPIETAELDPETLAVGDRVWVQRLRSAAEVVEATTRGKVRVSAGMMKLWVDVSDLRAIKRAPATVAKISDSAVSGQRPAAPRTIRTRDNTLDVRGLRADDAVAMAEAFLDRMYGAAEPCAFILHGVGSGALRAAIHEHLSRDNTYVEGFRPATQEEGGPQLTAVSLK
jgi:DNA mismatch repair protein MutS2